MFSICGKRLNKLKNFCIFILIFQETKIVIKKFIYDFDPNLTNFTVIIKSEKPAGVLISVFSKALRDLNHMTVKYFYIIIYGIFKTFD